MQTFAVPVVVYKKKCNVRIFFVIYYESTNKIKFEIPVLNNFIFLFPVLSWKTAKTKVYLGVSLSVYFVAE